MAPVNRHQITVDIQSSEADRATKDVALRTVKLVDRIDKLEKGLQRLTSALSESRARGESSPALLQKVISTLNLLNKNMSELSDTSVTLSRDFDKLPKEIDSVIRKKQDIQGREPRTVPGIRGIAKVSDLAELVKEFRKLRSSESQSDRAILSILHKIFSELAGAKDSDTELKRYIRELASKIGSPRAKEADVQIGDVAKDVRDVGRKLRKAGDAAEQFEKSTVRSTEKVTKNIDEVADQVQKTSSNFSRATIEIQKDLSKVRSTIDATVYKERPILPGRGSPRVIGPSTGVPGLEKTSMMVENLAKSLDNLQRTIVTSLERGMRQGMEIIKNEAGEAFQVAPGKRELELNVANVRSIRRAITQEFGQTLPKDIGTRELVTAFKQAYKLSREPITDPRVMASQLIETLSGMNREMVSKMGRNVQKLFEDVQKNRVTTGDVVNRSDLDELHRSIVADAQATKELNKYITRLAVPLVRQTETGSLAFETKYGSQRVLSNFATVTTGLERLVKELRSLGAPSMEVERLSKAVEKAPLTFSRLPGRPHPGGPEEAETKVLAQTLLSRVEELGGRKEIELGYKRAIALRKMETQPGFGKEQARTFMQTSAEFKDLKKQADDLGISALEVARSLDKIDFENFYDVLDRLFKAGKTPFLEKKAAEIGVFDRNLRQVSGKVSELLGLMPMMEPGRPKRTAYDENTLRVFTKAVKGMRPEEQKRHIVDVDLLWRDIAKRAEQLGEGVFAGKPELGRPVATSLDLSDAASSQLKQFNTEFKSGLKDLNKTMISMGTSDVRGTVPFQQFASLQRQMSYTTAALQGGLPGGGRFTTPALVSAKEKGMIESGKYGTKGFGLNVLTELRNTASTFEDQIVIAGDLAKAFTQVTKKLVKPAASLVEGRRITEIEPGIQKATRKGAQAVAGEDFERVLSQVVDQYQEMLGVPQRYRGRADIAEIGKEIENVMREHRGKTVEVQIAKLTETFLNYFGRKISTRFGTKGVSVTPTTPPTEIKDYQDIAKAVAAGLKAEVRPGEGLGYAKMPKSVGQMLSEMIEETAEFDKVFGREARVKLQNQLERSGNKFIIDLFKDASKGLVTEEEAKKQRALFERVSKAMEATFGADLPTGVPGIKEVQELYKTRFPERQPYEMRPIEARISARGIAKRGLGTEVLEGIVNNLIGSTEGTTTLVDKLGRSALTETKEARDRLNQYLEEIGFTAFEDTKKMAERLKMSGASDEAIKNLKDWESQWRTYTDIVDEFGEKMQSFVAPKFLQVIEEPHFFKDWSPKEIEKGMKGAKLDFQSFAAMAGVFGEGSEMLKEMASSTTLASKEGWELIRAFQMLDPTMKDMREAVMKNLQTVSIQDLGKFEEATGTLQDFKGTIFDIAKFPTAFKLEIPGIGKGEREEMYVPGAALRGTYQEELMGAEAPTNVARYLANFVNAARDVADLAKAAQEGGAGIDEEFQRKFASTIRTEITQKLTDTIKRFQRLEKEPTPEDKALMESTIEKFKSVLSRTREAPEVYQEGIAVSELDALEAFASKRLEEGKYSDILGRLGDMLVGPAPESINKDINELKAALKAFRESGTIPKKYSRIPPDAFESRIESFIARSEERRRAPTVFGKALEAGSLDKLAKELGVNLSNTIRDALEKRQESMYRARAAYQRALGEEVIGKKKGIEQVFFQRQIPAVTGKAISAITDKTEDLAELLEFLDKTKVRADIDIPNIDELIEKVERIKKEHEDYISKAKQMGFPVLKEGEIGLPEQMAKKIPLEKGGAQTDLASLIKEQQDVFVESLRYPFTGTLSVQPHKARLMKGEMGKHAIAVPGAPKLDMPALQEVIDTLQQYVGVQEPKEGLSTLIEQREKAWEEGTEEGEKRAQELTKTINMMMKSINQTIPKFTNLEQKLDFDGDTLYVHAAQVEESRKEIKSHFDALGEDVTSVRNLFRSFFTAFDETDVASFAEMANVFSKKHPKEKGFEFLTKPYIEEDVRQMNLGKVMKALFSYQPEAKELEPESKEYLKAFGKWAKEFRSLEVLPEVAEKLNMSLEQVEAVYGRERGLGEQPNEVDKQVKTTLEEIARNMLYQQKYADAITGQLYKLHTGQTVEGMSRIARVSELETGFGTGLAGTGKAAGKPSQEFLQRWPEESIALGGKPVEEFATRVNEIMRFVIQKGMDVKHAGVQAVGKTIIENVGKTSGANIIMDAMEEEKKQFDELLDFNKQIENEVRLRLGEVSTGDLQQELKRFEPDIDMTEVAQMDRQAIINRIIEKVNIAAVFEELYRQIEKQAIKGRTKSLREELETGPLTGKKAKLKQQVMQAGGYERFAAEEVQKKAASDQGISLFKYITSELQPLYRLRTSMETMGGAAQRSDIKGVRPAGLPTGDVGQQIWADMEKAQQAAHTITKSLAESVKGEGRGVYQFMVLSALRERYKELEELQKLEQEAQSSAGKFKYAFTDVMEANKLAARIWTESKELAGVPNLGTMPSADDMTQWISDMSEVMKVSKEKLERLEKISGLPQMTQEERSSLGYEFEEQFGKDIFERIKKIFERSAMAEGEQIVPEDLAARAEDAKEKVMEVVTFQKSLAEQLRRVSEVIKTVPAQKEYLQQAFPDFQKAMKTSAQGIQEAQKEAAESQLDYADAIEEWYRSQTITGKMGELEQMAKTATAGGGDVPIKDTLDQTVKDIDKSISETLVKRKRSALQYLESQAESAPTGKEAPLFDVFRASATHGGGKYGGGTQEEAVLRSMAGVEDPSMLLEATAFRGGALHRRKQREILKEFPQAEIERPVEDLENRITGHIDAIYEKAGQKVVADIKTVYSPQQFEMLESIAKEIEDRDITIQEKLNELKSKEVTSYVEKNVIRRLEDYLSQVNIYMKNVEGAIGEIIAISTKDPTREVTIPIGGFDPERFQKDLAVIDEARSKIMKAITAVEAGFGLPKDLFKDYPEIYQELSKRLESMSPEEFARSFPTQKVGETPESAGAVLGRLTEEQEKYYDRLSQEYLDIFEALGGPGSQKAKGMYRKLFAPAAGGAAGGAGGGTGGPGGPTGTGTGDGDGFDPDKFRKRIEAILAKLRKGQELSMSEVSTLISSMQESIERSYEARAENDTELAKMLENLHETIKNVIEESGETVKSFEKMAKIHQSIESATMEGPGRVSGMDFSKLRESQIERIKPERPEALYKNLKALYEAALRVHDLGDIEEVEKFGPEIADLLKETGEKGPGKDIAQKIRDAIEKLPEEQRGSMRRIWMFYKKAVGDYFVKRLDDLSRTIEEDAGTPEARRAYNEFEAVVNRYLNNIRGSLTKMSDIYTKVGPTGKKTEFVEPEAAQLTGLYKSPQELNAMIQEQARLSKEVKPVMDMLVGDLDPSALDQMARPIEKIRAAFKMLTQEDADLKKILNDMETFNRLGREAAKAWDFDKLLKGITQLRAGLQSYHRLQVGGFGGMGEDYTEDVRKNVEDTIKYLKQLEQMMSPTGGPAGSPMGMAGVPPFLGPETQRALHRRNIAKAREHYETPEDMGGPARGEAFTYRYKIVDPATKQTLENVAVEFRKMGDTVTDTGKRIGVFREDWEDLVKSFQSRQGFGQAFGRVVRWGVASRTVYGLVDALDSMLDTISDVELGIAVLRQVMSPLETDFEAIQQSAVDFAKNFGLPIRQVIEAMRVFAQQGLEQSEVVDRTRTSMLAANVTTLEGAEATEALTAAMKVYGDEAQSTLRVLDAWTQVESRHAITSKDLAQALQKAAAVAKTSGVAFNELNAIVTGIGETTRQTGKEIGTSLRFMFRRMQAEKGPKELSKIGIPVLGETGELRKGFDILGDLANQWKELSNAQRLSIAQAIGGRRHYNSLIVLMDHWDDVLDTLSDSINSKGAAERRNAIVMETYAKKVEQVRAAVTELQVQFGKAYLPIAKQVLDTTKFLIEAFTNIPPAVKAAMAGFAGLFVMMTKGSNLLQNFMDTFSGGAAVFGDFASSLKRELKKSLFEITGRKAEGFDPLGMKTFMEAGGTRDLETFLGKTVYMASKAGRAWNNFLTDIAKGTASATNSVSKFLDFAGDALFGFSDMAATRGGTAGGIAAAISAAAGSISEVGGYGLEKVAKLFGLTAEQMARLTKSSTGVVGALGPMVGSFFALKPLLEDIYEGFKRTTLSAQDYEKSIEGIRMKVSGQLDDVNMLSQAYNGLSRRLEEVSELSKPEVRARAMEREEYRSPLHELGEVYSDAITYSNRLAEANIDLVSSFDKFGNAVLKSADNMGAYTESLREVEIGKMLGTELDVLGKYVDDLTKTTGMETFKDELKTFLKEIPVIGEMISKSIKVAPARRIKEITNRLNELLALREKYPLTTTFDVDIKEYKEKLAEARAAYKETYSDFRRILADLPTEGLASGQITEALTKPQFQKGFETIIEFEPRLQSRGIKGKLNWKDILGVEVLKRVYPEKPLDFTAALTKGLLEQRNALKREGEAFAGDIVLFTQGIADKYEMAGNQAILKMKETTDGIIEWTVEYFDKELMRMQEVPYEDVERFVQSIFPTQAIQDRLVSNIEVLQEFVAGAEAGLRGITEKTFKREFDLGARFFSDVPTTTLVQSGKGFEPGRGFGDVAFKQDWSSWIKSNFIEPMTEYRLLLEQVSKMQLDVGEAMMSPGLREDIEDLQNILKNNQVVIQYRAVHEDLMKTLSESTRTLQENIAAERNRVELLTQTSGYLKGFADNFEEINTGVQRFNELTAQQRLAYEGGPGSEFMAARGRFREGDMTRENLVAQISEIDKALIAIREISSIAEGFGATIPVEELTKYTEEIAKTGDKATGLLLSETKNITDNTGQTVERLDQILERTGDPEAISRNISRMLEDTSVSPGRIADRLEKLAERREKAADRNNRELVSTIDNAMSQLVNRLIDEVGVESALREVRKNAPSLSPFAFGQPIFGTQQFSQAELLQRALGNVDFEGFAQAMERAQPGITETQEFKELIKLQEEQSNQQIVSNKTLNQLLSAYSAFEHFSKVSSDEQLAKLDAQITELEKQRDSFEEGTVPDELTKKLEELTRMREMTADKRSAQATRELVAPIAIASQELAKSLGMTERQIRILGGSVAGTYAAWKLWGKLTGEPIPEYLEEVGEKSKEAAERMAKSGFTGKAWQAWYGLKDLVFGMDETFKEAQEEIEKDRVFTEKERKQAERVILGGERAEESEVVGGEGPGTLKSRLEKAMEEMRRKRSERGSTTEEQILNSNEEQLGVLHGIFESTKRTAQNTKDFSDSLHGEMKKDRQERKDSVDAVIDNVDKLRSEYLERRGVGMDPLKTLAGVILAATATGYTQEKRGDVGRFNELENRAERQAELLNRIIKEYPEEAAKAVEDFRGRIEAAGGEVTGDKIATELVKRAKDVSNYEEDTVNRLEDVRKTLLDEHEKINDSLEESSQKIARLEMAEQLEMQVEKMDDAIKEAKWAVSLRNNLEKEIGGALAGISIPVEPPGETDILNAPALGRIRAAGRYKGIPGGVRREIENFVKEFDSELVAPFRKIGQALNELDAAFGLAPGAGNVAERFEELSAEREQLLTSAREMQSELASMEGRDLTPLEQERYEKLSSNLDNVSDRIADVNNALNSMSSELQAVIVAENMRIESIRAYAQIAGSIGVGRARVPTGRGLMRGMPDDIPEVSGGPNLMREMSGAQRAFYTNRGGSRRLFGQYEEETTRLSGLQSRYEELIQRRSMVEARAREEMRDLNKVTKATSKELEILDSQINRLGGEIRETAGSVDSLGSKLSILIGLAEFQINVERNRTAAIQEFSDTITSIRVGAGIGRMGQELGIRPSAIGEIELPQGPGQLGPTARLYALAQEQGNTGLKKQVELYRSLTMIRSSEIDSLSEGQRRLLELQEALDKAIDSGDIGRAHDLARGISEQKRANQELYRSITDLNDQMKDLSQVVAAINLSQVLLDFEQIKREFTLEQELVEFKKLGEAFDKVLGGSHPLAATAPTYEMLAAGVPRDQLFSMNRYDAEMAGMIGRRQLISTEDIARNRFGRERDVFMYEQQQEIDELNRQRSAAERMFTSLAEARRRASRGGDTEETSRALREINTLIKELESQYMEAATVEETEGGIRRFKGMDLEGLGEQVEGVLKDYGENTDIIRAIESSNPILKQIELNTESLVNQNKGWFAKLIDLFKIDVVSDKEPTGLKRDIPTGGTQEFLKAYARYLLPFMSPTERASGGPINGPGGPRSDTVPIMASAGEFVMNAAAVNSIGKDNLSYMNKTGQIPGMAEGGPVGIFDWLSGKLGKATGFLEKTRLGMAEENIADIFKEDKSLLDYAKMPGNVAKRLGVMAGSAAGEIGLKLAKGGLDTFGMIEKISALQAKGKLGETAKNVVSGISQMGLEDVKSIASSAGSAVMEDIGKGGTGVTAGLLGSLSPGMFGIGKASKVGKGLTKTTGKIPKPTPEAFQTIFESKAWKEFGKLQENKLSDVVIEIGESRYQHGMVDEILSSPNKIDILKSIPEGSKYTGLHGGAAIILEAPDGSLVRVVRRSAESIERANIPEMLQSESRKTFADFHIEKVPKADTKGVTKDHLAQLRDQLEARGMKFAYTEESIGNIGLVGGEPKVIDPGAIVPAYATGSSFIPEDQLAMLHRGERVIPARDNTSSSTMREVLKAGEKIGEKIKDALEDTKLTASLESDTVKVSNVSEISDSLRNALSGVNGGVGADMENKIEGFMTEMRDKLSRQESMILTESEVDQKIEVLETSAQNRMRNELGSIKAEVASLEAKIADIYSKSEKSVDMASERSRLESKLHDLMSEIKNGEITPLKTDVNVLRYDLNSVSREVNELYDKLITLNNRMDLI